MQERPAGWGAFEWASVTLSTLGIVAALVFSFVAAPAFSGMYADFGGELPLLTKALIREGTGARRFVLSAFALGTAGRVAAADGHPHGSLELPCTDCHTVDGWRPLRDSLEFNHSTTGFPLLLSHEGVDCLSCHLDLDFSRVATACSMRRV